MGNDEIWLPSTTHKHATQHSQLLGKLWTQLHSLETAIRIALCELDGIHDLQRQLYAIQQANVGDEVTDNYFTRHLQLDSLIDLFNKRAIAAGDLPIESEFGELRHALAHGRVSSANDEQAIILINFKHRKGGVPVVRYKAVMTESWVADMRRKIADAISRVYSISKRLRKSSP